MQRAFSILLDILFWVTAAIYTLGGVHIQGKLKLTYVHDLWVACAISAIFFRLLFQIRFRDTSFGKSLFEAAEKIRAIFLRQTGESAHSLSRGGWLVLIIIGYSLALYFIVPILSYWSYGNNIFDLGIIENAVYNASQTGHFSTYLLSDGVTPLQYVPHNHLNLGLIFFAGLYRFFPSAEVLLFFQSLVLILAIIPVFKLGQLILPKELPSWWAVAFYLLWDPIYRMNSWDFHETPFIVLFCFWALYFIEAKRFWPALLSMLLMAIWREDAWWIFAGLSLYMGIRTQRWRLCIPLTLMGFVLFPLHFAFLNHVNALGDRYGYLGHDFRSALQTVLHDPFVFFKVAWANREFFIRLVLSSGGGLFLLGKWSLLPAVFPVAEVGLAQHEGMLSWLNHYVGSFTAPLLAATLYGWSQLYAWSLKREFPFEKFESLIGISLAIALTQLSFSLPGALRIGLDRFRDTRCFEEIRNEIPPDAPLLADSIFGARSTHREWLMMPNLAVDQTRAQYLVSADPAAMGVGLSGLHKVTPWEVVSRRCGYYLARRSQK